MTPPSRRSEASRRRGPAGRRAPSSYRQAVEVAKEYIRAGRRLPDRALAALRPRARRATRSTSTGCCGRSTRARTCSSSARAASRSSAPRPSRWSSSSAAASCRGRSPARRRRGSTDEEDRRLEAELVEHPKELAEHVMLVDLARNDVGRVVALRHRAGRRADDGRALQPRHASHLRRSPASSSTATGPSTCCGRRCRPARSRARRRCGRWRSSTSSSRPNAAPTPASSATSTSRATSTRRSRSARSWSAPDGKASVQAGAGIVADSDPEAEDEECAAKAAAVLAAVAGARQLADERRRP